MATLGPTNAEPAVAVAIDLGGGRTPDPQEFAELIAAAGGSVVARLGGRRNRPDPGTFIGSGKVEQLRATAEAAGATHVIFDHQLSPSQERNLERALGLRVLDRTGLILAIFARRARTHEGRLQVELAQLDHLLPRLVGRSSHLARQQGGIGLRGPGETQLETDRRLIRRRIDAIRRRLDLVQQRRSLGRATRHRRAVPTLVLAGYTNAGKSTLFNTLTAAGVVAADQLFATLDPTLRRVAVPGVGTAVLSDTVGFVRELPHQLVAAFRATLEEAVAADLILEVVDAADADREARIACVDAVLDDIGAAEVPRLRVFNKIDQLPHNAPRIDFDDANRPTAVWLSAKTGAGIAQLRAALSQRLAPDVVRRRLYLGPQQGRTRAQLYAAEAVLRESPTEDGGTIVDLCIPAARLQRILNDRDLNACSPEQ